MSNTTNANASQLTLYGSSISPNTWRVAIGLQEKGISYSSETPPGGFKSAEHFKLNSRGQVPILKDGETIINESLAQLLYLEKYFPEKSLMPASRSEYGYALGRLLEVTNLTTAYSPLMFRGLFGHGEVTKEQIQMFHSELERWNSYLEVCRIRFSLMTKGQQWFAGDSISLPDVAAFPTIAGAVHIGVQLDPKYPNLARWYKSLVERPSVKATWPFKDNFSQAHFVQGLN